MRIVIMTPGAGAMFCGNCLRDNALALALRRMDHDVLMMPLYLPLTLDETDQSANVPVFFGGINVYLQQKSPLFRHAPDWLRNLLASRPLLKKAAGRAAGTKSADLGDLTLSMLQGEEGHQARELTAMLDWLGGQPQPDVILLSNALLLGMARRLKAVLRVPILCQLQGEDTFLDGLPKPFRQQCWSLLAERAAEVDVFCAPSRFFAGLMRERLGLAESRVQVVHNGIELAAYKAAEQISPRQPTTSPVLGFFARMCREKGLHLLVDACLEIWKRGRVKNLLLKVGGSCGPADLLLVNELRNLIRTAGHGNRVEFHPNLDHAGKVGFLRSLTVFSVPATYGEAFGLYVIESLAAGTPVVLPDMGAFPELVESTGGGVLCAPNDPLALADALETLLLSPEQAFNMGKTGQQSVFTRFGSDTMAEGMVRIAGG